MRDFARGDYTFAGLEDTYFAAVFLPKQEGSLEVVSLADELPVTADKKEFHTGDRS